MALNREALDKLRTANVPLIFTPRCHPDGGTVAAYLGDGVMRVECGECGVGVVDFEVAWADPIFGEEAALSEPACPSCGWAMSDHGDPPKCPPSPQEPFEGGEQEMSKTEAVTLVLCVLVLVGGMGSCIAGCRAGNIERCRLLIEARKEATGDPVTQSRYNEQILAVCGHLES